MTVQESIAAALREVSGQVGVVTVQESTRITHTCNHRCGATFTVEGPDAAQIADEWHRKHLLLMHNSTTAQMTERLTQEGWEES